jgi:hypothetical protein
MFKGYCNGTFVRKLITYREQEFKNMCPRVDIGKGDNETAVADCLIATEDDNMACVPNDPNKCEVYEEIYE